MRVKFVVQFFVGVLQFDPTGKQSIHDGVLAGQDVVLVVVALSLQEEAFADLLGARRLR